MSEFESGDENQENNNFAAELTAQAMQYWTDKDDLEDYYTKLSKMEYKLGDFKELEQAIKSSDEELFYFGVVGLTNLLESEQISADDLWQIEILNVFTEIFGKNKQDEFHFDSVICLTKIAYEGRTEDIKKLVDLDLI